MSFAAALRRHLEETVAASGVASTTASIEESIQLIINNFMDDDENNENIALYSIQKIAKIAFAEFGLEPGEWYTPSRICYVIGLLHNQLKSMPATENLKVVLFSSSQPIYFEDFLEEMCEVTESTIDRICPCYHNNR